MCASLCVSFTAIQTRFCKLNLSFPNKAGDVFRLALEVLDALQEYEEARTWIAPVEVTVTEKLANTCLLESHECNLLDENWRLQHQLVAAKVERSVMRLIMWRARRLSPT